MGERSAMESLCLGGAKDNPQGSTLQRSAHSYLPSIEQAQAQQAQAMRVPNGSEQRPSVVPRAGNDRYNFEWAYSMNQKHDGHGQNGSGGQKGGYAMPMGRDGRSLA